MAIARSVKRERVGPKRESSVPAAREKPDRTEEKEQRKGRETIKNQITQARDAVRANLAKMPDLDAEYAKFREVAL